MSEVAQTQQGQEGPAAAAPSRHAAAGLAGADPRQEPQSLVRESIKYRRRAQEAERRAEALETEIQQFRGNRSTDADALERELAEARAETDSLRRRLETVESDRRLERELLRAGCADTETALALARERLAEGEAPEDPAAFARKLLAEKPHLRAEGAARPAGLPPATAPARAAPNAARQAVRRLAEEARRTGHPKDLMAYMRARRGR